MTKINKILIANRGEIACRVMKTCRKMGIGSVAVYSDADRKALHVRMADEAVHIGASPAAESYLVIDKIIAACKSSGADAVHPGYGFLSENPEFARRLKQEGITFIGPSPESMEAMGLKDAAKKLMEKAGVPVTPGYHGKDQSPKLLKAKAGMIGYPVLIKAVAGGGGKGMRKVKRADDFDDALASCMREAKSAFGDDRVLIEKYILSPRHIEVQVFGDTHGNVVHMFERDCSLQRRHQKVIEEAPAPGMTEDVRAAMTKAAIEAAQAVNYVGAGTVEFIVDGSGKLRADGFWFMEMNTRLQVEHPVTEMITGLDLVELQIRVAQGEKLPKQSEVKMEGHAVEARVYAEDPSNDFLPSAGMLEYYQEPLASERVDTGIEQRDRISVFYDPMIAKVITHCETRKLAIDELLDSLGSYGIWPVKHNCAYLIEVLSLPSFITGDMSTHTLANNHDKIVDSLVSSFDDRAKYAIWKLIDWVTDTFVSGKGPANAFAISDHKRTYAWRLNLPTVFSQTYFIDGNKFDVKVDQSATPWVYIINNEIIYQEPQKGNKSFNDNYFPSLGLLGNDSQYITVKGQTLHICTNPDTNANTGAGGNAITAPMPGKIIAVNAKPGDAVKSGDKLIIMEAMKMEMSLEAPRDGVVAAVHTSADALVSDGEILLGLEED